MVLKDPAEVSAYNKEYYEKHKEKMNAKDRKYRETHREKILEKEKEYRQKNKVKIKEYRQTEAYKKSNRIGAWKRIGVESEDFNVLYDYFINSKNCEECNVELTVDKRNTPTTRCLDHDHKTNLFRNVLCHSCNVKRRY